MPAKEVDMGGVYFKRFDRNAPIEIGAFRFYYAQRARTQILPP